MAQAVQFAILGLGAGAAYTLLAQGIVLIYRGSGIVNFAHGAIAMFGAFFCFLTLVEDHGWPVGAAIPVAVLLAALLGVVIQNGILRFMRRGRAARPPRRDARSADRAPGSRRAEALGQRLPPGRPVPAHPQLHVARMVRVQRGAGTRRRPGGPPDPARDRDRAHVRAVGLHPVHPDRARDLRERGERAGGGRARDGHRTSWPRSRGRSVAPPQDSPASCSPPTPG